MGYIQQFGSMLNELEDGELKTSLVNAFGNVRLDFEQAIEKRDTIKSELANYKQNISNLIGTDSIDGVKTKLEDMSKSSNKDVDKLKADLQAKYEADTNELRKMLDGEKAKYSELTTKHEAMLFKNEVERQGLLQGFKTDNPRVKDMLLAEIQDKLILENGTFYVKDSATGEKARDIKSGDYLSAKSVSDGMLQSNEWADFVSPQTKASGTGTPPANQSTPSAKKFTEYTSSELVELHRTNPTRYNQLKAEAGLTR